MTVKPIETLDLSTRRKRRQWLKKHSGSKTEIWLVFYQRHTGITTITYDEAVEEAICYGWIDSLVKRLDDDRYVRKFTPRKPDSKWSAINRKRYADLKSRGLLAVPGKKRAPENRSGYKPKPSVSSLPSCLERALKANPRAWKFFCQLAPSYRRAYIGWIVSAKRQETREKRLREATSLLAAGKKLGLK